MDYDGVGCARRTGAQGIKGGQGWKEGELSAVFDVQATSDSYLDQPESVTRALCLVAVRMVGEACVPNSAGPLVEPSKHEGHAGGVRAGVDLRQCTAAIGCPCAGG